MAILPDYFTQYPATARGKMLLLHGFCEDASVWDPALPFLADHAIIRMHLPGFGGTLPPAEGSISAYVEAVWAVLDAEKTKRVAVIGHSLGGYVALALLAQRPERVAGLGLLHSHPFEDDAERIQNRLRGIEMLRSGKRDLYVAQLFPGLFAPAYAEKHPEIVQELIKTGQKSTAEGIIAGLEAMIGRRNHEDTLQEATCPVSWYLGEADALIPVPTALRAAVLPHISNIHIEPGVGHMGMYEAPESCAAWLRQVVELAHH